MTTFGREGPTCLPSPLAVNLQVCVCVCVCVCVRARACVCACALACTHHLSSIQYTCTTLVSFPDPMLPLSHSQANRTSLLGLPPLASMLSTGQCTVWRRTLLSMLDTLPRVLPCRLGWSTTRRLMQLCLMLPFCGSCCTTFTRHFSLEMPEYVGCVSEEEMREGEEVGEMREE